MPSIAIMDTLARPLVVCPLITVFAWRCTYDISRHKNIWNRSFCESVYGTQVCWNVYRLKRRRARKRVVEKIEKSVTFIQTTMSIANREHCRRVVGHVYNVTVGMRQCRLQNSK